VKSIFFCLRQCSVLTLMSYHQAPVSSLEAVGAALPEQGGKINAYVDGCIASDFYQKSRCCVKLESNKMRRLGFWR